eukprot:207156_1
MLQPSQTSNQKQKIFIIDEIGKMELFSKQFAKCVDSIINNPSFIVIATVPNKHNIGFVERLKRRHDSKLYTLTRNNRSSSTAHITKCVFELIDSKCTKDDEDQNKANDNDQHSKKYYNSNQKRA